MTVRIEAGTPSTEKPTLLIQNLFNQGTVTVSSETADGAGANALSDETFDFWTPATANATITVDMGVATEADACGIAAHDVASKNAVVNVRSSPDGITWTTRGIIDPANDTTSLTVWPVVSARYWQFWLRVNIASIGVIKLGKRVIVPSGVSLGHVSVNHAERIELLSNDSLNGQFLGTRVERRSGDINLDMGLVSRSFIEGEFAEFERMYNEGRTFFYCGSPLNLPLDVGYCKRPAGGGEIRPSHVGGDLMQLQFGAQVYVG